MGGVLSGRWGCMYRGGIHHTSSSSFFNDTTHPLGPFSLLSHSMRHANLLLNVPSHTGECPMGLTEELARANLTKIELADKLGVNRKTIQRMGEEVTPEVRAILNECHEPDYEWQKVTNEIYDNLCSRGRGVPVGGYVLIGTKDKDSFGSVVTEEAWRQRLDWTCKHGREGWSCKECLK